METKDAEILIVEDNPDDASLTIRIMKKHNLANNLLHVQDGAMALDYIFGKGIYSSRNIENVPKLILLDLKMPKVNGIEVLQELKSSVFKTIPVVILTSSNEDPDIKRCYELGANSYIVKPVNFDDFIKSVGDVGLYWVLTNTRHQ